jgi:hypothetical protein
MSNDLRRHIWSTMLCVSVAVTGKAQFSSGTDGFVVKNGTAVALDGLTITPDNDLILNNKTLQLSHTAIASSSTYSIQRVYAFNEAFNFTGAMGIFYLPTELNGNTEANLQIARSGAPGSGYVTTSGSTVDLSNHYVFNTLNAADIRIVSAVEAGTVLPVTLIGFTAKKENETAMLQWSTSFETGSSYFEIQRSKDGKQWMAIGQVAASGESSSAIQYSFVDVDPFDGDNLYRLKMVDRAADRWDETFTYSAMHNLRFENLIRTTLFPNPVAEKVEIKTADWSKVLQVRIINSSGGTVYESIPSDLKNISAHGINIKHLSAGVYIVKVTNTNGLLHSITMIKY